MKTLTRISLAFAFALAPRWTNFVNIRPVNSYFTEISRFLFSNILKILVYRIYWLLGRLVLCRTFCLPPNFSVKIANGTDGILDATLEEVTSLFAHKDPWKIFRDCQQLTICKQCNSEYFQWEKYRKKKTFNLSMQQLKRIYCRRNVDFSLSDNKRKKFNFPLHLRFWI